MLALTEEGIEEEIMQADEIKERIYAAQSRLDCANVATTPARAPATRDPRTVEPTAEDPPHEDRPPTRLTSRSSLS